MFNIVTVQRYYSQHYFCVSGGAGASGGSSRQRQHIFRRRLRDGQQAALCTLKEGCRSRGLNFPEIIGFANS